MQSDDNQPRQDDKSSQVEHTNGLYSCGILYMLCGVRNNRLSNFLL